MRLLRPQLILSLCDRTGNWSRPYEEDGYEVVRVHPCWLAFTALARYRLGLRGIRRMTRNDSERPQARTNMLAAGSLVCELLAVARPGTGDANDA